MKKIALFPGTFDPFTKGHEDVVLRGLAIFDKIIVAIGVNQKKNRYFEVPLMQKKIAETFSDNDNVSVVAYTELTATIAKKYNAKYLLRGLRNTTDLEYENSVAQINKNINLNLETVFLITSPKFSFINSSIVRELHRYGSDANMYLPYTI